MDRDREEAPERTSLDTQGEGSFKQTGLSVRQDASGEITIHQKDFIDNIKEIDVHGGWRKRRT